MLEVHKIVGILLFVTMTLQIVTGIGYKISKTKDWKIGFKKVHFVVGLILIGLVLVQLVTVWNF